MIKVRDIDKRIKQSGLKKEFIMSKLDLSRGTFYARLRDKEFKPNEILILKELKLA